MNAQSAARLLRKRSPKTMAYIERSGWRIEGVVKGGHIRLRHDDGFKIQIPATPSDRRGDLAARTRLMNKERKHRD